MSPNPLRGIPSVNELLDSPRLRRLVDKLSHNVVVNTVRTVLEEVRAEVQAAAAERTMPDVGDLAERIAERVAAGEVPPLRPAINATGILLHTGLGRAPLAEEAIAELTAVSRDYASVELDLTTGRRSRRTLAVESLLRELTGAEAALVVNNNAAATMLALAALAAGREVIVSRGQLVEIGGSYRLPDVMAASGAVLREVGTTNKTRAADYAAAINENTAALLLVHPSNFVVVGFAESPPFAEVVAVARRHKLPLIDDIGSGALVDFGQFGFSGEPVARSASRRGPTWCSSAATSCWAGRSAGSSSAASRWSSGSRNTRWPARSASASSRFRPWRPRCDCIATRTRRGCRCRCCNCWARRPRTSRIAPSGWPRRWRPHRRSPRPRPWPT